MSNSQYQKNRRERKAEAGFKKVEAYVPNGVKVLIDIYARLKTPGKRIVIAKNHPKATKRREVFLTSALERLLVENARDFTLLEPEVLRAVKKTTGVSVQHELDRLARRYEVAPVRLQSSTATYKKTPASRSRMSAKSGKDAVRDRPSRVKSKALPVPDDDGWA